MAFVFSRLFSIILRVLQLICAAIVAGIVGDYIDDTRRARGYTGDRFIYTIIVASLSLFASVVLLIPFTATFTIFPLDLLLFVLWLVAFSLLADFIAPLNCTWGSWSLGPEYYLSDHTIDACQRWKAGLAFCFISSMLWLLSALLAMWIVWRHKDRYSEHRRRWYRSGY